MPDQIASQNETSGTAGNVNQQDDSSKRSALYDFRRPDRVAKDQLRSIHSLHENFARSVASSLSAYLRTYVSSQLIAVEQLSFSEVLAAVSSPTSIVALRMRPHEGAALLEVSNSIVFPMIEILLGGTGKTPQNISRDTTEIERSILDGVLRLVLKDLTVAWQTMAAEIEFFLEGYQSGPDLFRFFPPNEAMLEVSMELTMGQHKGLIIISIPSIIVKMQRQKLNQQVKLKKGKRSDSDYERMLRLVQPAQVNADVRLNGQVLLLRDLVEMNVGDVVSLGYAVTRPLDLHLNGTRKFRGQIISKGSKRGFHVTDSAETM
jgi:flagellar motor switch protein FliM